MVFGLVWRGNRSWFILAEMSHEEPNKDTALVSPRSDNSLFAQTDIKKRFYDALWKTFFEEPIKKGVWYMIFAFLAALAFWWFSPSWWSSFALGISVAFFFVFVSFVTIFVNNYRKLGGNDENVFDLSILPKANEESKAIALLDKTHQEQIKPPQTEEPLPDLSVRVAIIDVFIYEKQNLILSNNLDNSNATVYGIEFRFQPAINISRSIELEAFIEADNQGFKKGVWLDSLENRTELSASHSNDLILAVLKSGNFYLYEVWRENKDGKTIPYGKYHLLSNDTQFIVEFNCKRDGRIILTNTARLRLYDVFVEEDLREASSDTTFFNFTEDSPINNGYPLLKPKN